MMDNGENLDSNAFPSRVPAMATYAIRASPLSGGDDIRGPRLIDNPARTCETSIYRIETCSS